MFCKGKLNPVKKISTAGIDTNSSRDLYLREREIK